MMKEIAAIISALGILAWAGPKLMDKIYFEIKKTSLEQVSKKMTPLSSISQGLTGKKLDFETGKKRILHSNKEK